MYVCVHIYMYIYIFIYIYQEAGSYFTGILFMAVDEPGEEKMKIFIREGRDIYTYKYQITFLFYSL